MVDRVVRWLVIIAVLVVFVLLKGRIGLVPAAVVTGALLVGAIVVLPRLDRGHATDRDRTRR